MTFPCRPLRGLLKYVGARIEMAFRVLTGIASIHMLEGREYYKNQYTGLLLLFHCMDLRFHVSQFLL
jgi:hypothetical protein